ncbi:MAG: hypothetical protein O3B64_03980 [bacterium]|nr:hypothetical protein [bacterium]
MIHETLESLGLPKKEAKVYLALLELGKANIATLTKVAGLPRSTIYSTLEPLERKGLVFSFIQRKTNYYTPKDPKAIVTEAQNRANTIKELYPDLRDLYQSAQIKPHIRYYEGKGEIREMYNGILKTRSLKEYDIIAAEEAWVQMDPRFIESFKRRRAETGVKTRLILEHSKKALERKHTEEETNSEVKIIPPGFGWKFTAGCYIFENKVIFLAYKKEHVAIEIQSKEIAGLMKMNFEFMWRFLA